MTWQRRKEGTSHHVSTVLSWFSCQVRYDCRIIRCTLTGIEHDSMDSLWSLHKCIYLIISFFELFLAAIVHNRWVLLLFESANIRRNNQIICKSINYCEYITLYSLHRTIHSELFNFFSIKCSQPAMRIIVGTPVDELIRTLVWRPSCSAFSVNGTHPKISF